MFATELAQFPLQLCTGGGAGSPSGDGQRPMGKYLQLTGVLGAYAKVSLFAVGVGLPLGFVLALRTHFSGDMLRLTQVAIYTLIVVGGTLQHCAEAALSRPDPSRPGPRELFGQRWPGRALLRTLARISYGLYQLGITLGGIIVVELVARSIKNPWSD